VIFPFSKGHGTHNDFIVLPDLDGTAHGDLDPSLVAALCDRRGGLGADGVLRVVRGGVGRRIADADWFMDYRNADGSASEMCGNGVRVFARYLAATGLVDPVELVGPLTVDTRDGVKLVTYCDDDEISVDMGAPKVGGAVDIRVDGRLVEATEVDMGNPHAVVCVDSLSEAGDLLRAPGYRSDQFPDGVNVEFVSASGQNSLAMRVHERGVGETWSCGTGACAAVAATATREQPSGLTLPLAYAVTVPGGVLTVTWDVDGHLHLKGPAVIVATGTFTSR